MIVGILGGGQLGRMLALAGIPLGFEFRFVDELGDADDLPSDAVATRIPGGFEDEQALAALAAACDVVTYEFENVPLATVRFLAARVPLYPPPLALETAQDRLHEKTLFRRLGIPVPRFETVDSLAELEEALEKTGLPAILKTRRFGYDGKGQAVIRDKSQAAQAFQTLGGVPLILEQMIPFQRELSLIAVRGIHGETAFYPLIENHHREGILDLSVAPAADVPSSLQHSAESHGQHLLDTLDYVGVLAIEFFEWNGRLLANEMAPRVHNSGHWTQEGAETSQFENHLRAIAGLPLGSPRAPSPAAMLNLVGTVPEIQKVLAVGDAHLHLYGKKPRARRKLGHVNVRAASRDELALKIQQLRALIS